MDTWEKKKRWGCIIIVIIILLPYILFYGTLFLWELEIRRAPTAYSVERGALNFIRKYEDEPIDNDEEFVDRYIELAPHLEQARGFPNRIQPYLKVEDVYDLIGEPTAIYNGVTDELDDTFEKYVYDFHPYIAAIDVRGNTSVRLDYYTDIYYEATELENIFYERLNASRIGEEERDWSWLQSNQPSKIEQFTYYRDSPNGKIYFLSSQDINDFDQLQMSIDDTIFEYYPELVERGDLTTPSFDMSLLKSDKPHEIEQHLSELIIQSNTNDYDLNQLGTSISEVNESLNANPRYYHFNETEPNLLNVQWKLTNGNRLIDLIAEIDIEGQTELSKEKVHNLSISTIEAEYSSEVIGWQLIGDD
ncbi:hypothetical protein HYO62_01750 [Aerococcaceae bacterium DSM 111022]|nr:hypothetical protein [Aerococcaceae bacterium DSM 111022]